MQLSRQDFSLWRTFRNGSKVIVGNTVFNFFYNRVFGTFNFATHA